MSPGSDPDPEDLGYYAPGHDLVLYYGDRDAAERIATLDGSLTAVVEALPR